MAERQAHLFAIPQTEPFLDRLAAAILAGQLPHPKGQPPEPLALARYTILLPSRRACRALADIFLKLAPAGAILLPRIRPLGDVDEVLALVSPHSPLSQTPGALRPAVPELERRLLLTELVRRWSETIGEQAKGDEAGPQPVTSLAQASALARELMELMDEAELEGADLDRVHALGGDFAEHWQLTVEFLRIITEYWPAEMAERNQMTAVARRDLLIRAEAARIKAEQPSDPIVLAGEIGGVAATGELMEAIARLPNGCVVLPGLDRIMDAASWQSIVPDHPEHPQYGLKHFLDRFGLAPADVPFVAGTAPTPSAHARLVLISETMRPASTTHLWHELLFETPRAQTVIDEALAGMTLIEAANEREEAEAIALILRHTAETPDQTAALVTPDRRLARRVLARMEKWGLRIDDTGGEPLTRTRAGTFSDLVIETANNDFAPATLLALLKHPLTRLGRPVGEMRRAARALELLALRQHHLETGLFSIRRNLQRSKALLERGDERHPVIRRLRDEDKLAAEALLDDLEAAFSDLAGVFRRFEKAPMRDFAALHRACLVRLAARPTPDPIDEELGETEVGELWQGPGGEALLLFFEGLAEQAHPASTNAREYAGLYRSLMADETVRDRLPVHPRLKLLGPMEARLAGADIVILGALNEGSWPQPADADAWLSRPMRTEVGLPAPERKIGRSAHDFAQALGAKRVYLSRAGKIDGVPSVPSRWLLRLQALAAGARLGDRLRPTPGEDFLALARLRDRPKSGERLGRPNPAPPLKARPRRLSVTRVEQWIANPYAIFARHILDLEPLPDLAREPDAMLRGQIIHAVLHEFSKRHGLELPEAPGKALAEIAAARLDRLGDHPRVIAFWKPQFERFSEWFGETEAARREGMVNHLTEIEGRISVAGLVGPFELTARADRMDLYDDGSLTIYDYKSRKMEPRLVRMMMAPQLPLEAAIALEGGFAALGPVRVRDLTYISVTGREERGIETRCNSEGMDARTLAGEALAGLDMLVRQYDVAEVGYPALRRAGFSYTHDDFEHLARVKEWAVEEDEG
jgi:ATP-dependent helicase/nuclease subunit B